MLIETDEFTEIYLRRQRWAMWVAGWAENDTSYSIDFFTCKREHFPEPEMLQHLPPFARSVKLGPGCKVGQIWSNWERSSPHLPCLRRWRSHGGHPSETIKTIFKAAFTELLREQISSTVSSLSVFSNHRHGFVLFILTCFWLLGSFYAFSLPRGHWD